MSDHNVGDPGYNANGFRWGGGANKRLSSSFQSNDKDPNQRYKILLIRGKAVYHSLSVAANSYSQQGINSSHDGTEYVLVGLVYDGL
jgi:hypothetical protein